MSQRASDTILSSPSAERSRDGLVVFEYGTQHRRLVLNRPAVHNALNAGLIASLTDEIASMPSSVRTVVIEGRGPSFCAGADLKAWHAAFSQCGETGTDEDLQAALAKSDAVVPEALATLFAAMQAAPQIIVAQVHGVVAAGGVGLAAAADLVVASDDARFRFSEVRLGLIPAMIAPFIVRAIGLSKTRHLFLTAAQLSASEAYDAGLVHQVVPAAKANEACAELLVSLWRGGPQALAEAKALLAAIADVPLAQQVQRAHDASDRIRRGPEMREGVRAFIERSEPAWRLP